MSKQQQNLARFQEIASRGLQDKLAPDKRARFDEALKRGLITGQATAETQPQAPATPAQQAQPEDSGIVDDIGNLAAGLVRGAGSIGATILAPYDVAKDAIQGKGLSLDSNRERRRMMDDGLETMGADTDSLAYQGGKLATEIAGTLPVGGVLASGAKTVGAPAKVVSALSSGGFSLGKAAPATTLAGKAGNAALRTGSGAAVGGTAAGVVNPEQAATGATIGGALPGSVQLSGVAGKAANNALKTMSTNLFGTTTGAGAESVRAAFNAGRDKSRAFLDNMRGKAPFEDIVASAKDALSAMRIQRQAAYRLGMKEISKDKTVLDFAPIDEAVNKMSSMGKFKGVEIRKKASETVDDLTSLIDEWRGLNPDEYHTPEGLDALKQAVGDIRDSTQFGTPARRAADQVYNGVKSEITKQAPTYSSVMREYAEASKTLKEVEKALSLGDKASADTAVRKLQSLMRNNAQTSYGNRLDLARKLEDQGGAELTPAIAGQAMNSWTPRGMVGAIEKAGIAGGAIINPAALAVAPITSPRIVGESAYALGKGAGKIERVSKSAINQMVKLALKGDQNALEALLRTSPAVTLSGQAAQQ